VAFSSIEIVADLLRQSRKRWGTFFENDVGVSNRLSRQRVAFKLMHDG
jgi:hypothetical protein